jgi:hypothetical protein
MNGRARPTDRHVWSLNPSHTESQSRVQWIHSELVEGTAIAIHLKCLKTDNLKCSRSLPERVLIHYPRIWKKFSVVVVYNLVTPGKCADLHLDQGRNGQGLWGIKPAVLTDKRRNAAHLHSVHWPESLPRLSIVAYGPVAKRRLCKQR